MVDIRKRTARADTIIDFDDLLFLVRLQEVLDSKIYDSHKFITPQGKKGIHFDILKTKMNMSHNAFLTHLRRLEKYNFIGVLHSAESKSRFEGVKLNYVFLHINGIKFKDYMLSIDMINKRFDELFNQ
jgi:hypothetical protein